MIKLFCLILFYLVLYLDFESDIRFQQCGCLIMFEYLFGLLDCWFSQCVRDLLHPKRFIVKCIKFKSASGLPAKQS